jgi:outer membrane protein assembly factor BamB
VDAETGKTRWKVDRSAGGFEAFATPIVHKGELIVQGSFRVEGYAAASGERLWWVRRQGYNPKGTPVVIGDALIVSAPGSDEPQYPAFDAVVATYDVNKDGRMSRDEVKANADMYEHWGALDSNGDGYASRDEYEVIRMLGVGDYGMVAVQLGGRGDLTERAIRWRDKRAYPNVPSPLAYRGVLYSVKNGGIVTTHNPENGSVFKTGRATNALGDYWSSPVAAAGRVYVASAAGKVVVLAAKPEWEVLAVNDVEDEIFATPLPAGERLYVRTRGAVYCFGEKQ